MFPQKKSRWHPFQLLYLVSHNNTTCQSFPSLVAALFMNSCTEDMHFFLCTRLRLAPSCHPPFRPLARESRAQGTCVRRQPFAREVQPSSDTRSMFSITWRSPGKVMGNQNSFDIGPCNAAQGIPVKGQPASFSVPAGSDLSPLAGYTPATPCHLATNH